MALIQMTPMALLQLYEDAKRYGGPTFAFKHLQETGFLQRVDKVISILTAIEQAPELGRIINHGGSDGADAFRLRLSEAKSLARDCVGDHTLMTKAAASVETLRTLAVGPLSPFHGDLK